MKQYSDQQAMIEDYLGNHMTPDEMRELEHMANDDPELAKQIAEQRLLIAALQEQGRRQNEAFAQRMKAIPRDEMEKFIASKRRKKQAQQPQETEKKEEKKRNGFFNGWAKRTMLAAAAFLGVILCVNLYSHIQHQNSINSLSGDIYAYSPTPSPDGTAMRGDSDQMTKLNEAVNLVQDDNKEKHEQGLKDLQTIYQNPDSEEIRLHAGECLAIALIVDGEVDDAEKIVQQIEGAKYYDDLKKLINDLK